MPFHVVGKHTAYAVKFTSTEFVSWDRSLARLQVRAPTPRVEWAAARAPLSPSVRRVHGCRCLKACR